MASTKADNNREAWTYTDDLANDYRVSSKTVYTSDPIDGAKYGGSQAAATVAPIPRGFKMRKAKCSSAGNPDIWIPCYDTTCDLWATPGTTVTRDLNGVDVVYTSTASGRRSEKRPRDGITQTS
jgi:hypothetical protein